MILEFDTKRRHTTRAKDSNGNYWRVKGKCLRCGQCCNHQKCDKLAQERIDGNLVYKCTILWEKPFWCALYPYNPEERLYPGCGFHWEKE